MTTPAPFYWPIDRVTDPLPPKPDPVTEEWTRKAQERNAAETLATTIMYYLSGRQFGSWVRTVRPCRGPWPSHQLTGPVTSYLLSWEGNGWYSFPCGCKGSCRVSGPRVVHLGGPVQELLSLQIEETTFLAPALDDMVKLEGSALYRVGGPWPRQDLGRPLGEKSTWAITYRQGRDVPAGVGALTGVLAAELETALDDDGQCRLPRTVTVASRQGVTYRAYDPAVIYQTGKTGLAEIDLWLAAVNPHALMAAPSVR